MPKVGGTKDVKLERIRELAPTHVLVNMDENRRETVDALAAFVPHIVVTHPNTPQDNLALFALLGGLFGAEDAAAGWPTSCGPRSPRRRRCARRWPTSACSTSSGASPG